MTKQTFRELLSVFGDVRTVIETTESFEAFPKPSCESMPRTVLTAHMDIRLDKLADFNETQFAKEANFVPGYYTNSDRITKDLTKNKIYMQVKYNCPRN